MGAFTRVLLQNAQITSSPYGKHGGLHVQSTPAVLLFAI